MYDLIFSAPAVQAARRLVHAVAKKNVPVVVLGETGTGKEEVARMLYRESGCSGGFVPVNCSALPEALAESELFGSVRGAFTDSKKDRLGLISQAEKGVLFLDELQELSPAIQSKLLRVLQDRHVRPVGSNVERPVNFRLVVALNVEPQVLVTQGRLREDLRYRFDVVRIAMPPLRMRTEDIIPLAEAFLRHYASEQGGVLLRLSSLTKNALLYHAWPGNIRQLQNEMQRLCATHTGPVIAPEDLRLSAGAPPQVIPVTMAEHKHVIICRAVIACGGNLTKAGQLLDVARSAMYKNADRMGLKQLRRNRSSAKMHGNGSG